MYLMPVFWFGLSALRGPWSGARAAGVFVVLHLLAYPASNGCNSYYDKDEDSIGGRKPRPRSRPSCCTWCGCLTCWRWAGRR
ncbi:MAG: UbiA family prenyltransferase [Hymenobacter sp.]